MRRIESTYLAASDENRRALNRFWFQWLAIVEDEVVDQEFAELPGFILDEPNL